MKVFNRDSSFIGSMVVSVISSAILLGASYTYSATTGAIKTTKDIQHYQEVLRFSSRVYSRALKQISSVPGTPDSKTIVLAHDGADSVACNGTIPGTSFTETYTLAGKNIMCQIDAKPPEVLIAGVDDIRYHVAGNLVEITIKPKNWHSELMPDGFKLDISMTTRILIAIM